MIISESSPTRVDLSGGTLDCWPLYVLVGGSKTINLSISIRTYAEIKVHEGLSITLVMKDLGFEQTYRDLTEVLKSSDPKISLLQKQLAYWRPTQGLRLETFSESPMGGGLGGSSSLSISLIKAFAKLMKRDLDLYQAVTLSSNIEAQVLHKMTGTQDYYPALSEGLNVIHYSLDGPRLEKMATTADFWNSRLSLVYTGQPHHSGLNNWQVLKAALNGEAETLKALHDIRDVSDEIYCAIKDSDWEKLPELFDREFSARVRLAAAFTSPEINRLRNVALKSGAQAVKICGAGGGGCVMVWSRPDAKAGVEEGCRAQGFEVLNVKALV